MLLLFWKNFTSTGLRSEAVYYAYESGGRSLSYPTTQTRTPEIRYTVEPQPSGVSYRHEENR